MNVKKSLGTVLSLVAFAVVADPAPVADLSRSSGVQSAARQGSVTERLTELERVVEARAQSQLQMQQQLDSLMNEVSELRGATEEHNYKLEQILQQQRDIYQEIDRRLGGGAAAASVTTSTQPSQPTAVPAGNPAAVVAADQLATTDTAEPTPVDEPALSEDDAFNKARELASKKASYQEAIKAFEQFAKDFPESGNAPIAHYLLGQLYLQKSDYKNAKANFDKIVKKYPESARVPDALLKLGMVAQAQNDGALAKKYYNQLIKRFPKSKPAAQARQRLETI